VFEVGVVAQAEKAAAAKTAIDNLVNFINKPPV
jgi:hypothetical protein